MVQNFPNPSLPHAGEYKVIKSDLLRLLVLNTVYLAGILLLYFTNQQSHYLDRWLSAIFVF
ncbi:MAG: hypothetical protein AAB410_02950 [Patescibacteria group bacterium]